MEGFVAYPDPQDPDPQEPDPNLFWGCISVAVCVIVLVLLSVS